MRDIEEENQRLKTKISQKKSEFDTMRRTDHTTRQVPLTFSDDIQSMESRYRDIQNEMVNIQRKEAALTTKIKKKLAILERGGIPLLDSSLITPDY